LTGADEWREPDKTPLSRAAGYSGGDRMQAFQSVGTGLSSQQVVPDKREGGEFASVPCDGRMLILEACHCSVLVQ